MHVQLVSDIHAEFQQDDGQQFFARLNNREVDVLVVAGDVAPVGHPSFLPFLEKLCALYPDVVYVAGNHEFYKTTREGVREILADIQGKLGNLHVLDDSTVTIKGQRFVGTTLWFPDNARTRKRYEDDDDCYEVVHYPMLDSEGELEMVPERVFQHPLNDFNYIGSFKDWVWEANKEAVAFLQQTVGPDDIVVTHHVPSFEALPLKFRAHGLTPFYVCDLTKLIHARQPKLWCYGHTHARIDITLWHTRVVSNAHGYVHRDEVQGFHWRKVIEVRR